MCCRIRESKFLILSAQGFKFLINVAATMILGMSNTYQQLLTALKVDDLKHALYKYGDARVGTNSPFSINHKRKGRLKAWLAWILLICTSMVRFSKKRVCDTNLSTACSSSGQLCHWCHRILRNENECALQFGFQYHAERKQG